MLYLRLLEEKHEAGVIRVVASDRCAVFDEQVLDKLIADTLQRLRSLRKLKAEATMHNMLYREDGLQRLNVPYTIQKFVEKKC